jgi:protein-tyrosine phosphatase
MDYTEMIPGRLYAGSRPKSDQDWRTLQNLNVNAIVNIREEADLLPTWFAPIPILHFPIGNKSRPSLQTLDYFVTNTISWLAAGRTIYIHDVSGRNRLGFFLIALYMRMYHIPYDKAFQMVRKQRPKIAPRYQFIDLLHEYERTLGLSAF